MKRLKTTSVVLGLFAAIAGSPALADEFAQAADALCQKQKSCLTAQMGGQEMPPQMRQMMLQMVDGMCQSLQQNYATAGAQGHPLYAQATACMRSLSGLSCQTLEGGQVDTPECQEYERQAAQYSG